MTARRQAERRGRAAESLAAWRLRLAGYRILARRARTSLGEIDLVARRGSVVAFVEVKARVDETRAIEAVAGRQRARITRAAELFLARRPDLATLSPRFDVVLIVPWRWPRHLADAWRDSPSRSR
jgi:putative endonuclease